MEIVSEAGDGLEAIERAQLLLPDGVLLGVKLISFGNTQAIMASGSASGVSTEAVLAARRRMATLR